MELCFRVLAPTNQELIKSPHPNEKAMSFPALGFIVVECRACVYKDDDWYISGSRHRLGGA